MFSLKWSAFVRHIFAQEGALVSYWLLAGATVFIKQISLIKSVSQFKQLTLCYPMMALVLAVVTILVQVAIQFRKALRLISNQF